MKCRLVGVVLAVALSACVKQPSAATTAATDSVLARGRYLVIVTGGNDCHTRGYTASAGHVPERDWLTGDSIGWRGPWGTTYASNLRLFFQKTSEAQWLDVARSGTMRPPMPWHVLRAMSDEYLRAVYQLIHSLGPAGEPAPAYLPPGTNATAPKMQLVLSGR